VPRRLFILRPALSNGGRGAALGRRHAVEIKHVPVAMFAASDFITPARFRFSVTCHPKSEDMPQGLAAFSKLPRFRATSATRISREACWVRGLWSDLRGRVTQVQKHHAKGRLAGAGAFGMKWASEIVSFMTCRMPVQMCVCFVQVRQV